MKYIITGSFPTSLFPGKRRTKCNQLYRKVVILFPMILKKNILFIRTREMLDGYENYQEVQYLLKKGNVLIAYWP